VLTVEKISKVIAVLFVALAFLTLSNLGLSELSKQDLYDLGKLKPIDSVLKVKVGQPAPDFLLPSVSGKKIALSQFFGKKNVVLSFVPAAWTPVCSQQWPGYSIVKNVFNETDTVLLGITVDNLPTLHAWTRQIGTVWFHVLSDFWPHGAVAKEYGVFRPDGFAERAVFIIDKEGMIRFIQVSDINKRPDPSVCALELKKLKK
jgi:peroxiredoxin (alkyl hydroperoxide reductase subunit C)